MPKKNPQKSHHEWLEIHLITIGRMVQLEKEKAEVEKEKAEVEKEKTKLEEEKHEREKALQMLMKENIALKKKVEDLEVNMESAKQFSLEMEKPKQVLVCGDSHIKCISLPKLCQVTGRNIEFVKSFCSRNDWPRAFKPEISTLLKQVDSRATDLLITSPTSDLTNLTQMSQSARVHWIDLSAKTIINTAEICLTRFPALKNVTILEHLPR